MKLEINYLICHLIFWILDSTSACKVGYEPGSDGVTCIDINECEEFGRCSQICINTDGSYTCLCGEGFQLVENTCKAINDELRLLIADGSSIQKCYLDTDSAVCDTFVEDTSSARGVNYDFANQYLYRTDYDHEKVYSSDVNIFNTGKPHRQHVVAHFALSTPACITYDWINGNLYWTDRLLNTIEVFALHNNIRHTLINDNLNRPRAIVADPRDNHGWLYWAEIGRNPRIGKVGLDGSHLSIIVSNNIKTPQGLAIDFMCDRLYWVDSGVDYIKSSDLNGCDIRLIIKKRDSITLPISVAVFEDLVYWIDVTTHSIYTVDKFGRKSHDGEVVIKNMTGNLNAPWDLQIIHETKYPKGSKKCGDNNGGCSHICLPSPWIDVGEQRFSCACPLGMNMELDSLGNTCVTERNKNCIFGSDPNCGFPCRCTNNQCYSQTGECIDSECTGTSPTGYGWGGPGCRIGNVAFHKKVRQIGSATNSEANAVVDGNTSSCSQPTGLEGQKAWFTIDLGAMHGIKEITIYGDKGSDFTANLEIKIGNSTDIIHHDHCTQGHVSDGENATFNCDKGEIIGRYVSVIRTGGFEAHKIVICELIVMGHLYIDCSDCVGLCSTVTGCSLCPLGKMLPDCKKDCPTGYWGSNCKNDCGHCRGKQSCEPKYGTCRDLCEDGYLPPMCVHQTYIPGDNCPQHIAVSTVVSFSSGCLVVLFCVFMINRFRNTRRDTMRSGISGSPEEVKLGAVKDLEVEDVYENQMTNEYEIPNRQRRESTNCNDVYDQLDLYDN